MDLERTVAEIIATSSIARRRTTAALVKTRPATLKVDRRRQTMEQILTTGLKLAGEMVTWSLSSNILIENRCAKDEFLTVKREPDPDNLFCSASKPLTAHTLLAEGCNPEFQSWRYCIRSDLLHCLPAYKSSQLEVQKLGITWSSEDSGFYTTHHTSISLVQTSARAELELRPLGEKYQHAMRPTMEMKHCGGRGDQQETDTREEGFRFWHMIGRPWHATIRARGKSFPYTSRSTPPGSPRNWQLRRWQQGCTRHLMCRPYMLKPLSSAYSTCSGVPSTSVSLSQYHSINTFPDSCRSQFRHQLFFFPVCKVHKYAIMQGGGFVWTGAKLFSHSDAFPPPPPCKSTSY